MNPILRKAWEGLKELAEHMGLVFIVLGVPKLGMNHDLCEEVLVSISRIVTICYRVHLLSATVKEGGISHQFNEKICSDRVGLYFLPAMPKKAASAINSTKKSAQIGSGFTSFLQGQRKRRQPSIQQRDLLSSGRVHLQPATVKVGGVSHQFNKKICSAWVGF